MDSIISRGAHCAPVEIGVTKICRIAGWFLLIAMFSITAQGMQPGEIDNISRFSSQNPASSMAPATGGNVSSLQVVQVTNRSSTEWFPYISGNWIVWTENERLEDLTTTIHLYDIANGSEKQILNSSQYLTLPEISGNWIGWVEYQRNSSGDYHPCVRAYNILSNTTVQVTTYPAMPLQSSLSEYTMSDMISGLGISDGRIVWHDKRSGNLDIYIYNLSSGEGGQRLSFSPDDQASPSISGDLVVWEEENGREYDIFLYNLTSKDLKRITHSYAVRENPRISGDHVVWAEVRNGNYDVCCYNVSSGNTTWITDEPVQQIWPRISGDIVVWTDNRTGDDYEVYAYDLSAQTEIQVTNDRVDQIWADVDSNNIVWMDNRRGNHDIFMCSLGNASSTGSQMFAVRLNSIPEGADIYLDKEPQGSTPSMLYFDQPGNHHIRLVKNGFKPYTATLDISASMTYVVNLEREVVGSRGAPLTPVMRITVDSVPRGANVSIDGIPRGTTLFMVDGLPLRNYVVNVTLDGYETNSTIVNSEEPVNVTLISQVADEMGGDGLT